MASIGLAPQDLKYKGSGRDCRSAAVTRFGNSSRLTAALGGGGHTTIGDQNLFMAYVHVAHDCHIGNFTIFGNAATVGGHVTVEDFATISAFSRCISSAASAGMPTLADTRS